MKQVRSIAGRANELAYPDKVHSSLTLRVWVLDQDGFGLLHNVRHFGKLDKVIDALSFMLEMKAGVLKGEGELGDGLADILDLSVEGGSEAIKARFGLEAYSCVLHITDVEYGSCGSLILS